MLTLLRRLPALFLWFWRGEPSALAGPPAPAVPSSARGTGLDPFPTDDEPGDFAITRYPPFDQGIPAIAVEKILQSQQELMNRIFRTAGVSRADFDRLYLPPVRNLARHVHLLPATSKDYFRGTGGLFRMSLEVALNALQAANAAVFPVGGGVERRVMMQPRWTLATFLAGLCSQNYRTVNAMAVLTRDNQQWPPLLESLSDWCHRVRTDVYFVRWMEELHVHGAQASAAYSISQVVPHEVLQYLASDNNQVVQAMTAAIAGVETSMSENPIGRLVAPVVTRVMEGDLRRSATNYGHLVIGVHLEMHLVDAMRRLVRGGKWIPNNVMSGGRLWVGQEGVFIDWPVGAGDIANLLARDSFAGIPKDPDTLADLLVSAKLLQLNPRGGRYWTITLPGSMDAKDGLVKLGDGTVIFPQGFDFEPYRRVQLTLGGGAAELEGARERRLPASDGWQSAPAIAAGAGADRPQQAPLPLDGTEPKPRRRRATGIPEVSCDDTADAASARKPARSKQSEGQAEEQAAQSSGVEEGLVEAPQESAASAPPSDESAGGRLAGEMSRTAAKLLGALKRNNAWLLNEVLQAYRKKTLTGVVAVLPYGVGISHTEFNGHGVPAMDLLEELALKQWLWQDKARVSRRIHPVEVDGTTHRMIILKPDVAAGLGFHSDNGG